MQVQQALAMLQPLAHRAFALVWVARCLMFLCYTTIITFMFFYLQDAVHYTQLFPGQTTAQGVSMFFAVNVVSIIIASVVGGIISDRLQRRKLFVIAASVIMAVGLLLYAFFPVWSMVLVGTVVVGIGFGVYQAVDTALASQVLPAAIDRGKDMGIRAHDPVPRGRRHHPESLSQLPGAVCTASGSDFDRCSAHRADQDRALASLINIHPL